MATEFVFFGLLLAGIIVFVAWTSEILSRITRIPNIIFYLIFAIIIGPLGTLIATIRSEFTIKERLFMGFFGPLGIVIAATGVFFSLTIALDYGFVYPKLTGYIFLIVLMTVVIQLAIAPVLAKTCEVCTVEYNKQDPE